MALFLLSLAKAALTFLPTAHFVALKPAFPFRQAHYAHVFQLKPALFCKLFAGLGSTIKSAISLLLSSSPTLTLSLQLCPFLRLFFYLNFSGRSGRTCHSSCTIRLLWVLRHSFLPGNDAADELARRRALHVPSVISNSNFSSHLSHSLLTAGVLSYLNSLTHMLPRFPLRNLCSLVMLAATDTAYC